MKTIKLFAMFCAALVLCNSCLTGVGTDEDMNAPVKPQIPADGKLELTATPSTIVADGEQFSMLEGVLCNKADSLFEAGRGTIRYQGKWDLIDMFLVSESIADKSFMEILEIPFLMTYEKKYPGIKPLRTYSGPRYIGGVSDHCPIVLCFFGRY